MTRRTIVPRDSATGVISADDLSWVCNNPPAPWLKRGRPFSATRHAPGASAGHWAHAILRPAPGYAVQLLVATLIGVGGVGVTTTATLRKISAAKLRDQFNAAADKTFTPLPLLSEAVIRTPSLSASLLLDYWHTTIDADGALDYLFAANGGKQGWAAQYGAHPESGFSAIVYGNNGGDADGAGGIGIINQTENEAMRVTLAGIEWVFEPGSGTL